MSFRSLLKREKVMVKLVDLKVVKQKVARSAKVNLLTEKSETFLH